MNTKCIVIANPVKHRGAALDPPPASRVYHSRRDAI
jgi:hypothetical protein